MLKLVCLTICRTIVIEIFQMCLSRPMWAALCHQYIAVGVENWIFGLSHEKSMHNIVVNICTYYRVYTLNISIEITIDIP